MKNVLPYTPLLKEQVEAIIRSVDADNSGTIDFDEFLTLMSDPRFSDLAKDEHREVFNMFDKDGSGHISPAELKDAFRSLGQLQLIFFFPTGESHRMVYRPEIGGP
jgi:Ca2+-binding EF-hand superfamily protein